MKFRILLFLALDLSGNLLVTNSFGKEERLHAVTHNIPVRLTGVRRNKEEPFNLVATFVTYDKTARALTVEFPAHPADAHAATIVNVIGGCVSWNGYGSHSEWLPLDVDLLLSVPPNTQGAVGDFSKWSILSVGVPDHMTAHWKGDAVSIDQVIEQSERIVVAKCLVVGPLKANRTATVELEVENVIKGAETNRQIIAESIVGMLPGNSYLVCIARNQAPYTRERPLIGKGPLPIMEVGWSRYREKLSAREQLAEIIATKVVTLKEEIRVAKTEYERLKEILQVSHIQKSNEPTALQRMQRKPGAR